MHDIAIEIDDLLAAGRAPGAVDRSPRRNRERLAWGLTAAIGVLAIVAVAASFYIRRPPDSVQERRLQVVTPPTNDLLSLAISPDGRRLAFVVSAGGKTQLWLRAIDSVQAQPLPGTEESSFPFWSPDSRSIGFFADGKLKRADLDSGLIRVLANATTGRGGTWNKDGVIVFSPAFTGLERVSASGGEQIPVTMPNPPQHATHRFPYFLPDGKHFVFWAQGAASGVYIGSLESQNVQRLLDADAVYVPSGSVSAGTPYQNTRLISEFLISAMDSRSRRKTE